MWAGLSSSEGSVMGLAPEVLELVFEPLGHAADD
jgi:hypothetical protein